MSQEKQFAVNPGWRILLRDIGLRPADVLRRAQLPDDLFGRERAALNTHEYFRLWKGIEVELGDPALALRIGKAISVEMFDPPVFAALCSPNLNVALERISRYKRLILPMNLQVKQTPYHTSLELEWIDATIDPPASMVHAELAFFVQLARIATREDIHPEVAASPVPVQQSDEYHEFFGVPLTEAEKPKIIFRAVDAERPFMTANEAMWKVFEPELRTRLSELDVAATMAERVQAALLELLPSGSTTIESVASRLNISTRTLQRRMKEEGHSFQSALNGTREKLALHYLKNPSLTGAEISFLLGYEDPSSFFRAFLSWTGSTPERIRVAMQSRN